MASARSFARRNSATNSGHEHGGVGTRTPDRIAFSETRTPRRLGNHDGLGLLGGGGDESQRHREHHRDVGGGEPDALERSEQPCDRVGQRDRATW